MAGYRPVVAHTKLPGGGQSSVTLEALRHIKLTPAILDALRLYVAVEAL